MPKRGDVRNRIIDYDDAITDFACAVGGMPTLPKVGLTLTVEGEPERIYAFRLWTMPATWRRRCSPRLERHVPTPAQLEPVKLRRLDLDARGCGRR